jgi:hypothetical protein
VWHFIGLEVVLDIYSGGDHSSNIRKMSVGIFTISLRLDKRKEISRSLAMPDIPPE